MPISIEQMPAREQPVPILPERMTFKNIMARVPDAVNFAKLEAESSRMAQTPEGRFALTYLLSARNLLRPLLTDLQAIPSELLEPTGGAEYNPERSIDHIGSAAALCLGQETHDIPNFWMRTEESTRWESLSDNGKLVEEGERFAVIDPLDMTNAIAQGNRVQTTGIAIYDRNGNMKTVGIMSLIDDRYLFIENVNGKTCIYHPQIVPRSTKKHADTEPLRVATLTRRMHALRKLPLFTRENTWDLDCVSGHATLELLDGNIDTVIDSSKGNPWYEVVIWERAAQELGFPVTDKDGKEIDISSVMRRVIAKHADDSYRIPFVISRTPEIHKKVLELLKPTA